jgi:hypothetical protein
VTIFRLVVVIGVKRPSTKLCEHNGLASGRSRLEVGRGEGTVGVREDGEEELLAVEDGYGELTEAEANGTTRRTAESASPRWPVADHRN